MGVRTKSFLNTEDIFEEMRALTTPETIDEPVVGIKAQYDDGSIDDGDLKRILEHYQKLNWLIQNGLFKP